MTLFDNKKHTLTFAASGGDKIFGRWSWIIAQGNTGRPIAFVTAYQPNQGDHRNPGSVSVLAQHLAILAKQKRKVHPRASFIEDLRNQLAA